MVRKAAPPTLVRPETGINPKSKSDQRWFNLLISQGYLPEEAIAKIESDKRKGYPPPEFKDPSENLLFYVAMGTIGIAIVYIYIKGRLSTTKTASMQTQQNQPMQGVNIGYHDIGQHIHRNTLAEWGAHLLLFG